MGNRDSPAYQDLHPSPKPVPLASRMQQEGGMPAEVQPRDVDLLQDLVFSFRYEGVLLMVFSVVQIPTVCLFIFIRPGHPGRRYPWHLPSFPAGTRLVER